MSLFPHHALHQILHNYGAAGVGVVVMLESMGAPLPGESIVIAAAVYAATTGRLDITLVVAAAAMGAIMGDNFGYLIGRSIGLRALRRFGRRIGLTEGRFQLGQYLFRHYGPQVVFIGRFIAILRTFAALLAGANRMHWRAFLFWNALGGIAWASLYGFGAYVLGDAVRRVRGPMEIVLGVVGAVGIVCMVVFLKRNEGRLEAKARAEMEQESPAVLQRAAARG